MHKYHYIPFIQDLCGWKHPASSFHIMHIFREANELVYYTANIALTCDFQWNFDTELDMQCKQLWYADAYCPVLSVLTSVHGSLIHHLDSVC